MKPINTKLYITAFILTIVIFVAALLTSNYFKQEKTAALKAEEDKITISILSYETQVDLLKNSSCDTFDEPALHGQLDDLSTRLSYMEQQVGENDPDVFRLKRYYSLLEIKDYLLAEKMADQCNQKKVFILYFYSDTNCPACDMEQYILKAVEQKYPDSVEVYSFDYNLDLSAVQTLVTIQNLPKTPPIIEINGIAYTPFSNLDQVENVIDPLLASTTEATSTSK